MVEIVETVICALWMHQHHAHEFIKALVDLFVSNYFRDLQLSEN